jgi:hypothetical protein
MRFSMKKKFLVLISLLGLALAVEAIAQCPVGWSLTSTRTKLYLYFASASDATFPEYDADAQTSPLEPFNVSDLDAGIGTTAALRNRITDIVKEDYCEFDVEIVSTTTAPTPTEALWQVVGIGSDDEFVFGGELFGVAQAVDLNNADPQDFARVYAKSFLNAYGPGETEPALAGASSTLERWATAIGHTTSHEAGHNFGLSHNNSAPRTGEDEQNNHIMATGSTGLTGEMRAGRNRHFSDTSYEILGHNIGLRYKTLTNWDFVNPNAEDAHQLVLTLLSPASTLTLNWFYNGTLSPWTNPTIAAAGTQAFQGTTYNKFTLTFSSPKAWSNGPNGVVPGGVQFHTGATFSETDLVIVFETRVKGSGGANLNLHPRLIGFNAGTADLNSGDFNVRAFNIGNPMIIEDLQVQFLPRMLSIESMINGARMLDVRGNPVTPLRTSEAYRPVRSLEVRDSADIRIATFRDPRTVDVFYDKSKCKPRGQGGGQPGGGSPQPTATSPRGPGDTKVGEIDYCPDGWAISLFPSTYVYLVATIVDPNARHWDRAQGKYVDGPLRTKVFHQFAGMLPDFNHNGIDDLIDIRTNTSPDRNQNGIIDSAEGTQVPPGGEHRFKWWWLLLLLILLIIFIWWLLKRRRRP